MNHLSRKERKLALIEEITRAFDGVSRENGVSFHESLVIDDYGSDEERAKARARDTETRWQDVPDDDIDRAGVCLIFLDEIGFRYYVPAFVVWFLRNMDNEDPDFNSSTFSSLIFNLGGNSDTTSDEFYLSKYRVFTVEQSKAIAHFLEFEAENEDANRIENERLDKELSKDGWSQEEIDDDLREREKFRIENDMPDNNARRAVENYWGRFRGVRSVSLQCRCRVR